MKGELVPTDGSRNEFNMLKKLLPELGVAGLSLWVLQTMTSFPRTAVFSFSQVAFPVGSRSNLKTMVKPSQGHS